MNDLLSALDFAIFMLAMGGLCGVIAKMPWYCCLHERLFPEVNDK